MFASGRAFKDFSQILGHGVAPLQLCPTFSFLTFCSRPCRKLGGMKDSRFSRRSLLAGAAAGLGSSTLSMPGFATLRPKQVRAKNIIFCVSDGMSVGTPSMADQFVQMREGRRGPWFQMLTSEGVTSGWMDTRSLNSIVTDSSAAASAWGSGSLVMNGAVNTLPGVGDLTPLYDLLGRDGMRRGLVTTCTITHATPSGFAVAINSRAAEPAIARQYRSRGVEVLLGGGARFFDPQERADKIDVYAEYERDGYQVVKTAQELGGEPTSNKLLGIFSRSHLPYSIDQLNGTNFPAPPTLTEMAKAAIARLDGSDNGFVLQIEGGRVDHGAHANDLGALLFDQLEFENAVQVALDFARKDGETLVVVTTDHGNANPGITYQADYGKENGLLKLELMRCSFERLRGTLNGARTSKDVQDIVETHLGIQLTVPEAEAVYMSQNGESPLAPFRNYSSTNSCLAMAVGNHTGVGFVSGSHTSDWVQIMAYGPGSEGFGGMVRNHTVFDKLLALRGIEFSNPKITLEEARAAMSKSSERALEAAVKDHWV